MEAEARKASERFSKLRLSLRYWMLGRAETDANWLIPLRALDFAESFHTGTRKDGFTPEFLHQLEIAHHLRTLCRVMRDPWLVVAVAILHDVCEDYDVGFDEIEALFGPRVAAGVRLLTKVHRGVKKNPEAYFADIAACACASLVKLADRVHNLSSMAGAFTWAKQLSYCDEAETAFLPMLKAAKRAFPDQEPAYENLKSTLVLQLRLCRSAAEAARRIEELEAKVPAEA